MGIPITALFSKMKDNNRKPSGGMFEYMSKNLNNSIKIDKKLSFYCGDRKDDNNFADTVGIQFFSEKKVI